MLLFDADTPSAYGGVIYSLMGAEIEAVLLSFSAYSVGLSVVERCFEVPAVRLDIEFAREYWPTRLNYIIRTQPRLTATTQYSCSRRTEDQRIPVLKNHNIFG